ncbi:hypothetical protein [Oryza sativa Japonica Group]|uniref:Uncharacterized protein n=1 Tax=Oryza sativa subsp. japonica TaxID=39947 RepID=Q5N8D4_ORYSJ|nr:hypothetical protein [Oryza sativa Japonica Group]
MSRSRSSGTPAPSPIAFTATVKAFLAPSRKLGDDTTNLQFPGKYPGVNRRQDEKSFT